MRQIGRVFALAGIAMLLMGAADDADERAFALAQHRLLGTLRDPDSAKFSGFSAHPKKGDDGKYIDLVICGWVNSRNGYGGMTGPQRFAVSINAVLPPIIDDGEEFATRIVRNMCSD